MTFHRVPFVGYLFHTDRSGQHAAAAATTCGRSSVMGKVRWIARALRAVAVDSLRSPPHPFAGALGIPTPSSPPPQGLRQVVVS